MAVSYIARDKHDVESHDPRSTVQIFLTTYLCVVASTMAFPGMLGLRLPIFTCWLCVYCLVHLKLRSKPDAAAFDKYTGKLVGRAQWSVAGRVYKAKSIFVLSMIVAMGAFGVGFHTAAVWSFALYAAEMFVGTPLNTATSVYAAAAAAMLVEWYVV